MRGFKLEKYPQWHAVAWLRETGEHRPALDVLRFAKELSPEFRAALADWIAKGSKRRKGARIVHDPWKEYPPKLAAQLRVPLTKKEQQAWLIFYTFGLQHTRWMAERLMNLIVRRRGPRITEESARIAYAAEKLGISERTAREWHKRFGPMPRGENSGSR